MSSAVAIRVRLLASVLSVLLVVAALAAGGFWWLTRRSLPQLDGAAVLPGLAAPVAVERDALGVPTVRGATRTDVARALGCVHAQDRFFQMDLLRRRAAGELSELFGKSAVPYDRQMRVHGFRQLARKALALLPPDQRGLVDAYSAGVNAGLAALRARPFEYFVLRVRPQPWAPEDSLLVAYALVLEVQNVQGQYERMLAAVQYRYGRTMLDFLVPRGTEFDAALDGSTYPPPPLPGPDVINLRRLRPDRDAGAVPVPRGPALAAADADAGLGAGSNAFALAGGRTANGSALLANDMHLYLGMPNIWYRASLLWSDDAPSSQSPTQNPKPRTQNLAAAGGPEAHRVTGVTVPGLPLVIAGSNGNIAWGFTNAYVDTADVIIVEPSGSDPMIYRDATGVMLMDERHETIRVKGHDPVDAVIPWTIWGPVIGEAGRGRSLALHWVYDDPAAVGLGLQGFETAADVPAALALAPGIGLPALNLIVADRGGAIGWTVTGRLPRRVGYDGRLPAVWSYGDRRWDGYLPDADYPRVLSPPSGQLWSANNRPVGGADLAKLGDGGYAPAARARQIRDDLTAITGPARPRDLLAIQLDDRARLLDRWQQLLLATLATDAIAAKPDRAELRRWVERWNGRASIDSVAYRLVRRWRDSVADRALSPIFAPCREYDDAFDFHQLNYEEPLWRLVHDRPVNLLAPEYPDWNDLLLAAADDVLHWVAEQDRPLARLTWGSRNGTRIEHPFSRFLPAFLARLLNLPREPLPGDQDMPRVQSPSFGASERFVVSPGHEEEGIFHMPGGQSGNPLSPFYRAGSEAWARGEPTPFLPGPAVHTLRLQP